MLYILPRNIRAHILKENDKLENNLLLGQTKATREIDIDINVH